MIENRMHHTPDSLIERNLGRACELLAMRMISQGTNEEINSFAENLHKRLDNNIDKTLKEMEMKFRINEALRNPKIA